MIKLIVARNQNKVIGNDNQLLWKLKDDLLNFKKLTTDNYVIMGRKTFESIGCKPLPNRFNFVLTNQKHQMDNRYSFGNVVFADYNYIKPIIEFTEKDVYIIGGSEIYNFFLEMNIVDELIITEVMDNSLLGDSYFDFNKEKFRLVDSTYYGQNERNEFGFKIDVWKRL